MMERINAIRNWVLERSQRERYFLFAIGFAVIYFFWDFILASHVERTERQIAANVLKARTESEGLEVQINTILSVVKAASYRQVLSKNKRLSTQTQTLNERLNNISPNIIDPEKISAVVEAILKAQEGINLVSIKKLTPELWISKEWITDDIPTYFKEVYRYIIEIELQSDYFSTIRYLQRIEKLPWPIYWDKLDYKVTVYPQAKIILKLYLLIHPKKVP